MASVGSSAPPAGTHTSVTGAPTPGSSARQGQFDRSEQPPLLSTSSLSAKFKDVEEFIYQCRCKHRAVSIFLDCASRFAFLGICLFDVTTDLIVAVELYRTDHPVWGSLTLFFIALHYLLWATLGAWGWWTKVREQYGSLVSWLLVPFSVVVWAWFSALLLVVDVFLLLHTLIPQACKPAPLLGYQWRFARGISEALLESLPQLALQGWMFLRSTLISDLQLGISITASFLGLLKYGLEAIALLAASRMGIRKFLVFTRLALQDRGIPLVGLYKDVLTDVHVTTELWQCAHPFWPSFCRLMKRNRGLQRIYVEVRTVQDEHDDTEGDLIELMSAVRDHRSLKVMKLNFPHCRMTSEALWALESLLLHNTVLEMVSFNVSEFLVREETSDAPASASKIVDRLTKSAKWPERRVVEIREVGLGNVARQKGADPGSLFYGGLRLSSRGLPNFLGGFGGSSISGALECGHNGVEISTSDADVEGAGQGRGCDAMVQSHSDPC